MVKNRKKTLTIVGVCIIILLIILIILLKLILNVRTTEQNLRYINSEEMDKGTVSPKLIHVVVASYKGNVNPKAISKATYYFINNRIPEYLKKCTDETKTKKYYNRNSKDINIDLGIDNEKEFLDLIKEINKLNGDLVFESSTFKMEEITVNKNNTEANLYIKYKDNPEISVKMTISNTIYNSKTSIKFSK